MDNACEKVAREAESERAWELSEFKRTGKCPAHDWIPSDRLGVLECAICQDEKPDTELLHGSELAIVQDLIKYRDTGECPAHNWINGYTSDICIICGEERHHG